ncbi:hypothetical protein M378DRAFT_816938 [Amanita muscaria Koide BX008]|uniref:Secreted protein n=1 Tax=Amanita muscaria (strain Koide BX008) TaxID=946122 RepID=A0A0C2WZF6_AMAMK|nr:hypothetical protein M378DRAFT_816938 [Amanita muscaria Koide BX008]
MFYYFMLLLLSKSCCFSLRSRRTKNRMCNFFQKLLKAEAFRRVRMCNLQSAKDCASVKTSLATVHARAQEMKNYHWLRLPFI